MLVMRDHSTPSFYALVKTFYYHWAVLPVGTRVRNAKSSIDADVVMSKDNYHQIALYRLLG